MPGHKREDTIIVPGREVAGGVLVFMSDHIYLVIGGTIFISIVGRSRGIIVILLIGWSR